jgi:hypothetical protein
MHRSVRERAVFLLVLTVLFVAYLRLSRTYPENSDEANILLMASDMARGSLYLSGWNVSDVPFITTELPEVALLVKLFGLHLETAQRAVPSPSGPSPRAASSRMPGSPSPPGTTRPGTRRASCLSQAGRATSASGRHRPPRCGD